jgi:hypothetical protein
MGDRDGALVEFQRALEIFARERDPRAEDLAQFLRDKFGLDV